MKKTLTFTFVILVLYPFANLIAKQPILNEEYILMDVTQDNFEGKTEVIEFFSYACIHCYQFEPKLGSWLKSTSADMSFKQIPAVFSNRMIPLAKLYYTLEELGKLSDFHDLVYETIHIKKNKIFSKKDILDWVSTKSEIEYDKFVATYNSFSIGKKANLAKQLTRKFKIPGTPYITIGGRYLTGPSMITQQNSNNPQGADDGHGRLFEVVESLIKMTAN